MMIRRLSICLTLHGLTFASAAHAADLQADPSNYVMQLSKLQPGDTLRLSAGSYANQLNVSNLNGSAQAWITIAGPDSGPPAIFTGNACCNTVELTNSSYVAIRSITVDALHIPGVFGLSAKGASNVVHHIRVENCTFINQDANQQTVAISTKTPTWGWEIRSNRILGAGTGMYLGNSDGSFPFIGGIIERNLIRDTIGYNAQIKFQNPRPTLPGIPTTPSTTIVRDNVFCKNDQPSPDGDRPNLLIGGFPSTGPGSEDRYEIYGNLFFHNPRESLLQVSGRVTVHDNLFVDVPGTAILAQNHDLPLRQAYVYNNTIFAAGTGIRFGSMAGQGDGVVGNLIFATTPIAGSIATQRDNVTAPIAMASAFLQNPSTVLSGSSFFPLPMKVTGVPLDLSAFANDTDWKRDFNEADKGALAFRGAYAAEGINPGWQVACDVKPQPSKMPQTPGGSPPTGTGTTPEGCSCRMGGHSQAPFNLSVLLLGGLLAAGMRRRARRSTT